MAFGSPQELKTPLPKSVGCLESSPQSVLAPRYTLRKVEVDEGVDRVHLAGLFSDDENTSRVLYLLYDHRYGVASSTVRHVWLVHDSQSATDVGMAMVSNPADDSGDLPVLNTYVDPAHQRQGIGRALLDAVMELFPANQVAAYYTHDAVRLYQSFGFRVAEFHYGSQGVAEALSKKDVALAERLHVQEKLEGRVERDEEKATLYRTVRTVPGPRR